MMDRIKACVEEHREEALAFLKKLISCDTTDYHEVNGQIEVEKFLRTLGAEICRIYPDPEKLRKYTCFNEGHTYDDRYCLVGMIRGEGEGRSILLNAHMDTVFPASPDEWRTDPFVPVENDGRLYGLGSADTKGSMSAMLMAVRILKELGVRLQGDIIFQGVVDEEAGGGNGSLACIDAGYRADGVLIGEPNGLMPMSAHMGSYAFWMTVEGKSTHGNMKWTGTSAFEKTLPLLNRLSELEKSWMQRKHELLPSPRISVLQFHMGDGSITIPGECKMLVNFTYLPDGFDYSGEIMRVIREYEAEDEWFREHPIRVAPHHDCGPYCTDPHSEWPVKVAEIVSDYYGKETAVSGLPCGADGRLYSNVGHMPTVIMGPGDIENAHKPNEFIPISEYLDAVALYAEIIYQWCRGGEIE